MMRQKKEYLGGYFERCQLDRLTSLIRHLTDTLDGDRDQAVCQWYRFPETRVAEVATF